MFQELLAYFESKFDLKEQDVVLIKQLFLPRQLKKAEFLLREGEIPRHAAFVGKGFLRSYVIDTKGKEHVIQFAPENWWISAKPAAAADGPSTVFIDAIEDSRILLIDRAGHLTMMEKVPGYAKSFAEGIQKRVEAKEKRIVHSLSSTAEERYIDFLETYPTIAQRIPQHMLASYLGITPETLSRIRRRAIAKK